MTKEKLIKEYDILQEKFGSKERNSVYGGGKEKNPELCLVFINPTARNIATDKNWTGVRYQWLGTKQIWQFLTKAGLFSEELNNKIQNIYFKSLCVCVYECVCVLCVCECVCVCCV